MGRHEKVYDDGNGIPCVVSDNEGVDRGIGNRVFRKHDVGIGDEAVSACVCDGDSLVRPEDTAAVADEYLLHSPIIH